MTRRYHIYCCDECVLVFAVEQAFDQQDQVQCPVCLDDDHVRSIAHGEMEEIPVEECA